MRLDAKNSQWVVNQMCCKTGSWTLKGKRVTTFKNEVTESGAGDGIWRDKLHGELSRCILKYSQRYLESQKGKHTIINKLGSRTSRLRKLFERKAVAIKFGRN